MKEVKSFSIVFKSGHLYSMALMEEDIEFLEDQIVPDQDDLFLPPAEVTWNVSYIILL